MAGAGVRSSGWLRRRFRLGGTRIGVQPPPGPEVEEFERFLRRADGLSRADPAGS